MNWLKNKLRGWLGFHTCPSLLAVSPVPDWTEEDAAKLKTFLQNPTGQLLLQKARAMQSAYAIEACNGKHHPKWVAGLGWSFDWLESLAISGTPAVQGVDTDFRSMADADTSLLEPA